jgi:hypothetical protein
MPSSAPNVNTVTLVGQLTADPVLRAISDGRNVCDLRLAVNDQRDQPPLFIDVATFGPARTPAPSTSPRAALSRSPAGSRARSGRRTASNAQSTGSSVASPSAESPTAMSRPPSSPLDRTPAAAGVRRLDGPLLRPDQARRAPVRQDKMDLRPRAHTLCPAAA